MILARISNKEATLLTLKLRNCVGGLLPQFNFRSDGGGLLRSKCQIAIS